METSHTSREDTDNVGSARKRRGRRTPSSSTPTSEQRSASSKGSSVASGIQPNRNSPKQNVQKQLFKSQVDSNNKEKLDTVHEGSTALSENEVSRNCQSMLSFANMSKTKFPSVNFQTVDQIRSKECGCFGRWIIQ